jgi:hypothetical protein
MAKIAGYVHFKDDIAILARSERAAVLARLGGRRPGEMLDCTQAVRFLLD